ncbi:MAG TPA: hypothetical protein VN689_00305, partial [Burkholderiales bacterium]|nr:hypothetical protein [Burkholderiales bacterium]
PGLKRRWYQDEFFDLYTWHAPDGALVSFQLCYDVRGRERALAWHREHGFTHSKIDGGDGGPVTNMTPLLVGTGRFPHRLVRERFLRHATALDDATRNFIIDKMREYGRAVARGVITLPRRARKPAPEAGPAQ